MFAHEMATMPPFPITKPISSEAKQASRLYATFRAATDQVHAARRAQQEAREAVILAEDALGRHLASSAAGADPQADVRLTRAVEDARILAGPPIHDARIERAELAQTHAFNDYRAHVQRHLIALVDELRGRAEHATGALLEALAKIEPERERYRAIRTRVDAFVTTAATNMDDLVALALPPGEAGVPVPADDALDQWDRRYRPDAYPAVAPAPVPNALAAL